MYRFGMARAVSGAPCRRLTCMYQMSMISHVYIINYNSWCDDCKTKVASVNLMWYVQAAVTEWKPKSMTQTRSAAALFCIEIQFTVSLSFHYIPLEPHLSRTSRALPIRVPRTRAAVRKRPRNSHSHASRGSAHFHAFAGRSSAHFNATVSRSSAHFLAIRSRLSPNFDDCTSHAFPRIPAQ